MRPLILAACLALGACATRPAPPETLLQGTTMGSAWTVKIAGELPLPAADLQAAVQARFAAVDLALSTWNADSALSRFNADDSGEWLDVDAELAVVMRYALTLAERSDGAYDITVGPLVNLWGFGPDPAQFTVPDAAALETARSRVGWIRVQVDPARNRARKQPGVRVDLSSLGKGHGVDRVAEYLDTAGVTNYLVDLSGKLRARGHNAAGAAWRVAVERPGADNAAAAPDMPHEIVELRDASIATAGDYRRYFESGGRHYSHIIDPRSGYPVAHATVSATVTARGCMEADALATMYMVMEPAAALRDADIHGVAALLIGRVDGLFGFGASAAWSGR